MKSQSLDPAGRRPPNIKKNSDLFNVQFNEVSQSQHEILFTVQNILIKKYRVRNKIIISFDVNLRMTCTVS